MSLFCVCVTCKQQRQTTDKLIRHLPVLRKHSVFKKNVFFIHPQLSPAVESPACFSCLKSACFAPYRCLQMRCLFWSGCLGGDECLLRSASVTTGSGNFCLIVNPSGQLFLFPCCCTLEATVIYCGVLRHMGYYTK